jgi:molybdopterin-guanine dinucleotide biosynthesis protein A
MGLEVTGYVLTGGASSRMGGNKALLEFDGVTLGKHAARVLRGFAGTVYTVGFPIDGITCIPDTVGKTTPASIFGLQAALEHSQSEWTAILACDLPFVTTELFELLGANAESETPDAVVPEQADGRIQPLVAIYRTIPALKAVNAMTSEGEFWLNSLFTRLQHRKLNPSEYSLLTGAKNFFFNINTPDDYRAALNLRANGV